VQTNQANTYSTGIQDFSSATMKLPSSVTVGTNSITMPASAGTLSLTSQLTSGTVTTTGSPASPNVACFSGGSSITDCSTSDIQGGIGAGVYDAYGAAAARQANLSLLPGTYANGDLCTYTASGTLLNCNTAPYSLPSTVVQTNQANSYTAGDKQTFKASATTAGLAFGGVTADPSSPVAGDVDFRTDLGSLGIYLGSAWNRFAYNGANSDITSLSGLTTPLTTAQGGTGAGVLTGYRYANGSGADTAATNIPVASVTGAAGTGIANTFTKNQSMTGLTLNSVANVAAPTGVATTVGGQSVPASTTNEAAVTCIDSSGANTTLPISSSNVTTTGSASYIVWSYTLPTGCTNGYIWLKNTGSFLYYSAASGSSFQQNAAYTTYTPAASYPVGGVYPTANTTGLLNGAIVSVFGTGNVYIGGGLPRASAGSNNTAQGLSALSNNTSGSNNTAQGLSALFNNTAGTDNTAQGQSALFNNTSGSNNTAQGYGALYANTSGSQNTALGSSAGLFISGGSNYNVTSIYSTYLGTGTMALASGDTDELVLGYNTVGNGSHTATLGSPTTTGTWLIGTIHSTATAPTSSAGLPATYSTNSDGEITGLISASTVAITFANSGWTNAAFCVVTPDNATAIPYISAISKTGFTITFTAAETGVVFYHCGGN
jgi:hypothetical protein